MNYSRSLYIFLQFTEISSIKINFSVLFRSLSFSFVKPAPKVYNVKFNTTQSKIAGGDSLSEQTKDDSNFDVSYVTGQRGSRKIVCGGYSYICAKINGDRKYWVCAKQRSRKCKARMITNADETVFVRRNQEHNHHSENRPAIP